MKKLIVAALVLGVVASLVNDAGKYLTALYWLDGGTKEVAQAAADAADRESGKSQPGGREAVRQAQERGFVVYGYQADDTRVQVWTKDDVEGTWVAGPFLALQAGKPLNTPLEIVDRGEAYIR